MAHGAQLGWVVGEQCQGRLWMREALECRQADFGLCLCSSKGGAAAFFECTCRPVGLSWQHLCQGLSLAAPVLVSVGACVVVFLQRFRSKMFGCGV